LSSKRIKISFSEINSGRFTVQSKSELADSNKRIKEEMKGVVREYEKNETISKKEASKLVLNA
jgi:hypothetical protein